MTIAAVYVSPEGVVLGADSTTTYGNGSNPHYFNHAQKLFEIGEGSTWAIVTWGLGGLVVNSHRTLVASLAASIEKQGITAPAAIAQQWIDIFWPMYSGSQLLKPYFDVCTQLSAKAKYDPATPTLANMRTLDEENELNQKCNEVGAGFCIAGYDPAAREPIAFEIVFDPVIGKPTAVPIMSSFKFWGAPNMIQRLIFGYDDLIANDIVGSGKWNGDANDYLNIVGKHQLAHAFTIPIREALDFVHACIYSTIKAFKFSNLSQICGGPIELAVITTDRKFRWVRHKQWDAAITEGEL